jgi:Tfp pilus assembly protein PilN
VIRSNLSTRPFYNERAVHAWLLVLAAIVAAATLFNISRVLHYSGSNTELATQASRDEARAREFRATAAQLRGGVDAKQIESASADARQANELIDRRTFSWTELFNQFETTLPADVRITSVRPRIDTHRNIVLTISVLARSVDDVNQFMEHLDATGAFAMLRPSQERMNEAGQIESVLEAEYLPHRATSPQPTRTSGNVPAPAAAQEGRR